MFCTACGAENKDTATFCRKCGEGLDETVVAGARHVVADDDEDETRLASRRPDDRVRPNSPDFSYVPPGGLAPEQVQRHDAGAIKHATDDEEHEIFSISPTLMFVKMGYVLAAIGALLLVAVVSAFAGGLVSTTFAVVLGLLLLLVPAFYHIKQRTVRYRLTETKLEVDRGLVARSTRNVPLRRIQDVTVSTTITQRLLGFGDIVIDNASEEGGKVVLDNVNDPRKYADMLLRQMSRLEGMR